MHCTFFKSNGTLFFGSIVVRNQFCLIGKDFMMLWCTILMLMVLFIRTVQDKDMIIIFILFLCSLNCRNRTLKWFSITVSLHLIDCGPIISLIHTTQYGPALQITLHIMLLIWFNIFYLDVIACMETHWTSLHPKNISGIQNLWSILRLIYSWLSTLACSLRLILCKQ